MDDATIIAKINAALIEEFEIPPEDLQPDAHIREDLHLDSLDIVDLVIVLEKLFAFKLPNREAIARIVTLGDIYAFIIAQRDSGIIEKRG